MTTKTLSEWEDAAICRASGLQFESASIDRGRVVFTFLEQEPGDVEATLAENVDLADAIRWARDVMFKTRRQAGIDAGRH